MRTLLSSIRASIRAGIRGALGVAARSVRGVTRTADGRTRLMDAETTLGDRAEQQLREWEEYRAVHLSHDRAGVSTDPESLPPEWEVLAHVPGPDRPPLDPRNGTAPPMYARLARPPFGGWVIVIGLDGRENKHVALACETFKDLYTTVTALLAQDEMFSHHYWVASERLLDRFVTTRYDRTDPGEAAEQVLVGLGAKPRFLPAALTAL